MSRVEYINTCLAPVEIRVKDHYNDTPYHQVYFEIICSPEEMVYLQQSLLGTF